jgi:hypothetical protein
MVADRRMERTMSSAPPPGPPERSGIEYVAALAQKWATLEAQQHWTDHNHAGPPAIEELVDAYLETNEPYPIGTAVFAAGWRPKQWGLAQVFARSDVDEWIVVFLDGSEKVFRDHTELCPAL